MEPELGCSSPAHIRNSVVLPHPDAPIRAMNSPFSSVRLTLSITELSAKLLLTEETLTAGIEPTLNPGDSTPVVDGARISYPFRLGRGSSAMAGGSAASACVDKKCVSISYPCRLWQFDASVLG